MCVAIAQDYRKETQTILRKEWFHFRKKKIKKIESENIYRKVLLLFDSVKIGKQ